MGLILPSMEIDYNETIGNILKDESKEFDFFRVIFERVCELCAREIGEKKVKDYEKILIQLKLFEIENFMLSFPMEEIDKYAPIKVKISMILYVWSLSTLQSAYKYCFYRKPVRTMVGFGNIYDLAHVLHALFSLEDVSASKQTGIVHRHFLQKHLDIEKKKKSEQARQAANSRHEQSKLKDKENLIKVRKIWKLSNWKSFTECANDILRNQLIDEDNYRKIYDLVSKAAKIKD